VASDVHNRRSCRLGPSSWALFVLGFRASVLIGFVLLAPAAQHGIFTVTRVTLFINRQPFTCCSPLWYATAIPALVLKPLGGMVPIVIGSPYIYIGGQPWPFCSLPEFDDCFDRRCSVVCTKSDLRLSASVFNLEELLSEDLRGTWSDLSCDGGIQSIH